MVSHRWTLQESNGAAVVDSWGGNNGTADASVTFGVAGPGGDYPSAVDLSGTSSTPIALDSPITLSRKHSWSVKFWAKQASANQQGMILGDPGTGLSFLWLSSGMDGLVVRPTNAFTLTGANSGLDIVFAVPNATRTKWSEYELVHDVSGPTPTVTLYIDSVLIASQTATYGIELTIGTIGAGDPTTAYAMKGQIAGVELSGTTIDYAKPDKVVLVLGQSNAEGQFDNHQEYEHPTQFASVFQNGAWGELFDVDGAGELWPLLATRWLNDREESVGFIYAAESGTGLVNTPDWADGGATYDAALATVAASEVTQIDAILWFQGERDANVDVERADYAAAMEHLLARLHNDLPGTPPLLCGQINGVPDGTTEEIRNAQTDAWENEQIFPGPVTYDLGPLPDDLHFTTDAEAITLADRWWAAIDEALFDGSDGTPPRLLTAIGDGSAVTLTFDRDLEAATTYDPAAWQFIDNGAAVAVTSASKTGDRTVVLTLASVPASSEKLLTLGSGISARGLAVPRGLGNQPALPETRSVTVPAQHSSTSSSISGLLRVKLTTRSVPVR